MLPDLKFGPSVRRGERRHRGHLWKRAAKGVIRVLHSKTERRRKRGTAQGLWFASPFPVRGYRMVGSRVACYWHGGGLPNRNCISNNRLSGILNVFRS